MRISSKHGLVVGAFLLMSGCASTELQMNLDLYSEDPVYVLPLTPAQVATMNQGLDQADVETEQLSSDRRDLAVQLFEVYESLYALATKAVTKKDYDPNDLDILRGYLKEYKLSLIHI